MKKLIVYPLLFVMSVTILGLGAMFYFNQDVKEVEAEFYNTSVFPPTGDNVSGFAWSENVGWISFNGSDCDNNCTGATCTSDGAPAGCPAAGVTYSDYGVKIDSVSGNFSGFAWSANVGWIYFGPDANLAGYGMVRASDAPATVSNSQIWGHHNSGTGAVSGWAKILSLGNDGWISLGDDDIGDGNPYGITISTSTGDFSDHAWNGNNGGNSAIGWVSFNCLQGGPAGGSFCFSDGGRDYKVNATVNQPPYITDLSAPNFTAVQACSGSVKTVILRWDFNDDDFGTESKFQVKLYDSAGTLFHDYGEMAGPAEQFLVPAGDLAYGAEYRWSVKVWDTSNFPSAETFFNTASGHTLNGGATPTDTRNFKIYNNEFPNPYFTWFPSSPSIGEEVEFENISVYYDGSSADNANWVFSEPLVNVNGTSTVVHQFYDPTGFSATSTVFDGNGYSCSTSTNVNVLKKKLPSWIETK